MQKSVACLAAIIVFVLVVPAAVALAQSPPAAEPLDGGKLYMYNCQSCHQADGKGFANLAPALKGNAIISGDTALLIQLLLKGPAAVLPADRPKYGANTMDSFYYKLTDDEMAAVLNYVRQSFGKDGAKSALVSVKAVTDARAKIDPQSLGN